MVKSIKSFLRFVHCNKRYNIVLCNQGEGFPRFTVGTEDDEVNFAGRLVLVAVCGCYSVRDGFPVAFKGLWF